MEGLHLLPDLLQPGDWMVKLDLKDAYLQVPIHPEHHFSMEEKVLHVQVSTVWPISSAQGIYKGTQANCGFLKTSGLSSDYVSRRHADHAPQPRSVTTDGPADLSAFRDSGTAGQPQTIPFDTNTTVRVSGVRDVFPNHPDIHSPSKNCGRSNRMLAG